MELIAAVSEVAAAAAAVEVEIFEVAAQTPAAEVLQLAPDQNCQHKRMKMDMLGLR